jgi:hypothetical protein
MRSLFITLAFSLVALVATASPKIVVDKDGETYTIHKIAKGETLYSLAKYYGTTVEELMAINEDLTEQIANADSYLERQANEAGLCLPGQQIYQNEAG